MVTLVALRNALQLLVFISRLVALSPLALCGFQKGVLKSACVQIISREMLLSVRSWLRSVPSSPYTSRSKTAFSHLHVTLLCKAYVTSRTPSTSTIRCSIRTGCSNVSTVQTQARKAVNIDRPAGAYGELLLVSTYHPAALSKG